MLASPKSLKAAADHLKMADPMLTPVITQAGLASLKPRHDYYQVLCDSIISQQLSVKAARSIENRFKALFGLDDFPGPELILDKSIEELRSAGLSQAKANYIRDLAEHVLDGRLKFDQLDVLDNQAVIDELTGVKGIGEWTAHMFLIFCMGRLDVLASGDLGIRNGVRKLCGLANVPSPSEVNDICIANHWAPYESVACWYIWRFLDNEP